MTANQFRRLALGLPEVEERAHMNHPDFRVGGKVFATLGYPDKSCGMVRLAPEEQQFFLQAHPGTFTPANGAWGIQGATLVRLKSAPVATVEEALRAAWQGRALKKAIARQQGGGL